MNKDKYVFAQMVEFLDNYKFLRIVKKVSILFSALTHIIHNPTFAP